MLSPELKKQILSEMEEYKYNSCKNYLIGHCGMKEDIAVVRLKEMFEYPDIASGFALFCSARGQDPSKSIHPLVLGYTPKKLMAAPHHYDAYGAFYSLCQLRKQGADGPLFKHLKTAEALQSSKVTPLVSKEFER